MGRSKTQAKKRQSDKQKKIYSFGLYAVFALFVYFSITTVWKLQLEPQVTFTFGALIILAGCLTVRDNRCLLFENVTPISVILLLTCLLSLAGLFYGLYPKFALRQFFVNTGSLCLFACAYMAFRRNAVRVYTALRCLAVAAAVLSLVSIELATSGYLTGIFMWLAGLLGVVLPQGYAGFETNTRIITTIGNPNVFAPIAVFGMLAGVIGFHKAEKQTGRTVHLALAAVCGAAFLLCFSLGTILSYAAALLVLIITADRGTRWIRISEQIFLILASFIAASAVFALRDRSILPTLAVAAVAAGGGFLYTRFMPAERPEVSVRLKKALLVLVPAVLVLFAVCALLIHGEYALGAGQGFRRAVALKPGDYTLSAEITGEAIPAEIHSMSYTQAALKETTQLAAGALGADRPLTFTVPEDAAAVFVTLTAREEMTVLSVQIEGASDKASLPLKYLLLPEFVVNRLQGLWVNDNAIQRFVFYRDGLRLGLRSPVIGLGGGAFEGGLYSAADYYYQTKHSHNQLVESFLEGGILGAGLFILLAVAVVRALIKVRKNEEFKWLFPFLCASATLIFAHSMLEVDFLYPEYRICTAVIFALYASVSGDALRLDAKWKKPVVKAAFSILVIVTAALAVGKYSAYRLMADKPTVKSLETAIWVDPFNRDDYMLSYILGTISDTDPKVRARHEKYLNIMKNHVYGLDAQAQYYLLRPDPDSEKGVEAVERYLRSQRANPFAWDAMLMLYNNVLDAYRGRSVDRLTVAASIEVVGAYLRELNETLPKQIQPPLAAYTYLRAATSQASPDNIIDSRLSCDLNADGVPDILDVSVPAGTAGWRLHVLLGSPSGYTLRVYHSDPSAACSVTLGGNSLPMTYDENSGCFTASIPGGYMNSTELAVNIADGGSGAYFIISANR